jgi:hypothetical protein
MYDRPFKVGGSSSKTNAPTIRVMNKYIIDNFHDVLGLVFVVINLPNPVPTHTETNVTRKKIPI